MGLAGWRRFKDRLWTLLLGVALGSMLLSCAPHQSVAPSAEHAAGQAPGQAQTSSQNATRVLRILSLGEPDQLSLKPLGSSHVYKTVSRLFNAGIGFVDEKGAFYPELVEALPQLGTDTWRIFPDGRMETT